ncbi:hypothetical protein HDU83_008992 [Entophlyctis luteolus]|nr:hypothetical protein HDU83_008992 [Entophlyctis luteolus]KAJ3377900.1 hypothetical protein HDU84_008111 [Entophlyctis sp. JEL0112]
MFGSSPASAAADVQPQRSRVGRKPKSSLPSDSRTLKNLQAQRAFRERKQAYVKSLEDEVADLRMRLSIVVGNSDHNVYGDAENGSTVSAMTPADGGMASPFVDQPLPAPAVAAVPQDQAAVIEALSARILALETENSLIRESAVALEFGPRSSNLDNSVPGCPGCATEKVKTLLCMGHIKTLEDKLASLESECQTLRLVAGSSRSWLSNDLPVFDTALDFNFFPSTITSESPANSLSDPPITPQLQPAQSAVQLYGPVEIEYPKLALRTIPALKDSKYVDLLFDAYNAVRTIRESSEFCCYGLFAFDTKSLIAAALWIGKGHLADTLKFLDISAIFLERNKQHFAHRDRILQEALRKRAASKPRKFAGDIPAEVADRFRRFEERILSINGLEDSGNILASFKEIVSTEAGPKEEKEDRVLHVVHLVKQLEAKCASTAERLKDALKAYDSDDE